jgi:serine/threonine protein kinase
LRSTDTIEVHRGRDVRTGTEVVIKQLREVAAPTQAPSAASAQALILAQARFTREIDLLQQVEHPHLVRLRETGNTAGGRRYLAMEYLPGLDLEQVVRNFGPLNDGRTARLLEQACQALTAIHDLGWIHRDIKPANLLLSPCPQLGERLVTVDFGLAECCRDSQSTTAKELGVAGTPAYISPEAAQPPRPLGPRSDIYSLGCVGYFLLCGQPPFTGHNPIEICWKQIYQPPDDLASRPLPGAKAASELTQLIMRCLAKDPLQRPPSAIQLKEELQRIVPHTPWTEADAKSWWVKHQVVGKELPPGAHESGSLMS